MEVNLDIDLVDHPKVHRLCELVPGLAEPAAVGHLFLLWRIPMRARSRSGELRGLTDSAIEHALRWQGERGALVKGLLRAGWLDGGVRARVVHGWRKSNNGRFVAYLAQNAKRKRDVRAGVADRPSDVPGTSGGRQADVPRERDRGGDRESPPLSPGPEIRSPPPPPPSRGGLPKARGATDGKGGKLRLTRRQAANAAYSRQERILDEKASRLPSGRRERYRDLRGAGLDAHKALKRIESERSPPAATDGDAASGAKLIAQLARLKSLEPPT